MRTGPDVIIDCPKLDVAPDCAVGLPDENNFRWTAGVRIRCAELKLGPGCVIERGVLITGGTIALGANCRIGAGTTIRVTESFLLGKNGVIGENCLIEGRRLKIGRELWCGPQVRIGGGSCFEPQSELIAGYWLHLGMRVFINTARRVEIGNEVGIGTGSAIYTHGAYQSALNGYPVKFAPVTIGDKVWIPGAVINPGVTIGASAVIGVGSVVTKDIPAGALATGVPCKVIRENAFPRQLTSEERRAFLTEFILTAAPILSAFLGEEFRFNPDRLSLQSQNYSLRYDDNQFILAAGDNTPICSFHLATRTIQGSVLPITEKIRDLLRRYGIRFKSETDNNTYRPWSEDV